MFKTFNLATQRAPGSLHLGEWYSQAPITEWESVIPVCTSLGNVEGSSNMC